MAIRTSSASKRPKLSKLRLLLLGLGLGGFYFLLPKFGNFHDSLALWHHVTWPWLGVALIALAATYAAAAAVYVLLALQPLRYFRTYMVQLASMFANRLLPAGIGAISVNYAYLRRNHHTKTQASAVVTSNNLLGFVGHMLLLVGVLVSTRVAVTTRQPTVPKQYIVYGLTITAIIVGVLLVWQTLRSRFLKAIRQLLVVLSGYRQRPGSVVGAVACSMALTSLYVLTLYACSRALGLDIAISKIFIVMTFGVVGATAVPTPGGLGGAEAGLVGGLILYGANSSVALGVALLYRLLTFWLSLVVGAVVFIALERRHYM